ncbi:MAG TPA: hypothetical protein VFM70_11985 [Salinimicrobium sp.]|nr:hypothetical protein [Salinimicrobium sp.]
MPSHTLRLHEKFENRTKSIERTRGKMELLISQGNIDIQDIEHLYAGLYMELFTEFESLIENLFFGLYNGSYISPTNSIVRKSRITPKSEIQPIIYGGQAYVNWLPYKQHTLKRAKIFFNAGEPFHQLTNSEKLKISEYHIIRNAIAHKSTNSLNKFNNIIAPLALLSRERTPTGYLRSKPSGSGQTQFEIAIVELKLITQKLCA